MITPAGQQEDTSCIADVVENSEAAFLIYCLYIYIYIFIMFEVIVKVVTLMCAVGLLAVCPWPQALTLLSILSLPVHDVSKHSDHCESAAQSTATLKKTTRK